MISRNAKLDYQLGYMVVRADTTTKVHLSEIAVLILESTAISLTCYLLSELTKRKIKVIFCDEKRNPSAEMLPYYGSHDTSAKVRSQIKWSCETKGNVWTEIVSEKIRLQSDFLRAQKKEEFKLLEQYVSEIEFMDTTNREGHAAKVYFNALFGLSFTRSSENAINAALNYGYSLLLSLFNREVVANGYYTQLGLFHDNMFNPFNLSSDLMEPFRIVVDQIVYQLKPDTFEHVDKLFMLRIFEVELMIDGRKENLLNAVRIYSKSVFDALNENDVSIIRFYRNEL